MIVEALIFFGTLAGLFYLLHIWRHHNHWQKLGIKVPSFPSVHPLGNDVFNCWDAVSGKANHIVLALKQAQNVGRNEAIYGTYGISGAPALVVCDADLVRTVLVKDFNSFGNRPQFPFGNKKLVIDRMLMDSMFFAQDEQWKDVRSTFSPVFTSGKMKHMTPIIQQVTATCLASIEEDIAQGKPVNLQEKWGSFAMDNVAACVFGVDAASFGPTESKFVRNAREFFGRNVIDGFKLFAAIVPITRYIMEKLEISSFKSKQVEFFYRALKDTIEQRQKSKEKRRNDIIDLMLDAMKEDLGESTDENSNSVEQLDQYDKDAMLSHKRKNKEMDLLTVAATGFGFLVAGYDTTSGTIANLSHILATHPDIQDKLHEEIDEAFKANGGKMPPYAAVQGMEYLDMVIHETLRIYPQLGLLQRQCTEDGYQFKAPGYPTLTLNRGDNININVSAIHMDPKYYPDPEEVIPERFSKEERAKRNPYAFLGFGQGPHNCVGMRFALLEAKVGLVSMLRKYKITKCASTPEKIVLDPERFFASSVDPIIVNMEKRNV